MAATKVTVTATVALASWLAVCLCLTTASPALTPGNTDGRNVHNITEGNKSSSDYLLFSGVIRANSSAVQAVLLNETCYPPVPVNVTPHTRISAFKVMDLIPRGEGGYSQVLSGGVDHPQVCIRLSSQPHKSYYFIIDVWGTYDTPPSSSN